MAYDYRGSQGPEQYPPTYPPYDERDATSYPASGGYYASYSQYPTEPRHRSRASSLARSEASQPQPIHNAANAVNAAFDRSDAAAQVDPALIAQISEQVRRQVIDSLKESGITGSVPVPKPQSPTSSTSASFPPRDVYTPPSPDRRDVPTRSSNSPDLSSHDGERFTSSTTPRNGDQRRQRTMSTSSSNTGTEAGSRQRPAPAERQATEVEYTTLEKIWQPLFGVDGLPTVRLGQFLRGLANHIINDYSPKKSLVITPGKMLKFYEDVKLPDEVYPWSTIFKLSNATICKVYRDLRCEHHLVQDHFDAVPHIPGLTADGFQQWMTTLIVAYPDLEFKRLSKAVLDMPISNADDAKERFPKELSRRLFPRHDNLQAQQRAANALACDGRIPVPKSTSFPPPPPPPLQPQGSLERERSPYVSAPHSQAPSESSAVADDDDDHIDNGRPPIPIERERKPYVAREGTGKMYADDLSSSQPNVRTAEPEPIRHSRTQSFTGQGGSWPIPGAGGRNSMSDAYGPPPGQSNRNYRANSNAMNGRRGRSPSFTGAGGAYGTRSDGNIGSIPDGYYASNINVYEQEDDLRKREYARHQAEEDAARAAGYGSNPAPRSAYDDEHYRGRGNSQGHGGYASGYGPRH